MRKRSIAIKGHRTSVSLEPQFWDALDAIARAGNLSLACLIAEIDRRRLAEKPPPGLASALRVFALERVLKPQNPPSGVGDEPRI